MSFICYRSEKENAAAQASPDKQFKETLLAVAFPGKTQGVPVAVIAKRVMENPAFARDDFAEFKTPEGLQKAIDDLVDEGFLTVSENPRLGKLYAKAKAYDATQQETMEQEAAIKAGVFTPAAPKDSVGSLVEESPELKKQLGLLYFYCNAWITSYDNSFTAMKRNPKTDSDRWWSYVLNGIRNLSAQKDKPDGGLLAGWKELGIDFASDTELLALRDELERIEREQKAAKTGGERDDLSIQANRLVANAANQAIGKELEDILPANEMYQPIPENTGKAKLDKDKRQISRLLTDKLNTSGIDDPRIADLSRRIIDHIRNFSLPSRFMQDQEDSDNRKGKQGENMAAKQLYNQFKPKGGLMNMSEFLTILLALTREAAPPIKLSEAKGKKVFVAVPKAHMSMIGSPGKGGITPVGSAPNAPRQRDNLMEVMGRRIPNRIISILQTGFPVWFNYALNAPLNPPTRVIPPSEEAIQRVKEEHGEVSRLTREAVASMDPSVPGFFDKAPSDELDLAMSSVAIALAFAHGAGEHKGKAPILALVVASMGDKATLKTDEVAQLQKIDPSILVYKDPNGGLRGKQGKDGKIVWRNQTDDVVEAPTNFYVGIDINNYDLFGNARRLDKQIDADYAYAHLHFVQWPIEMMMSERETIVNQTLGEKGMGVRDHIMKKHEGLESGKDKLLGREDYALRPVAIATGLKLVNNFITAHRASNGKTGGLVAEARERGMSDDDIKDALPRGVSLSGDFSQQVDDALINKHGSIGGSNKSEVFLAVFPSNASQYDKAINHMFTTLDMIDKRMYDFSVFNDAMQAKVVPGLFFNTEDQYIYTLNTLDDRHQSVTEISASWPGVKNPRVSASARRQGFKGIYADEKVNPDKTLHEKPLPVILQIATYDMLRSVAIDAVNMQPSLAALIGEIFGSSLKKILIDTNIEPGVNAYYSPTRSLLAGGEKTYGGVVAHEFGHAIDGFLRGYVDIKQLANTNFGAGEDDSGAALSRMDAFVKSIQQGKKLTGTDDLAKVIRAFYRIPYFSQFTARSPDEVWKLLDEDRPRDETMAMLKAAAEKAKKAGKDPHAAAREKLNDLVGEAISLHMFSPAFKKGALSGQSFAGERTASDAMMEWYEGKRDAETRKKALEFLNRMVLGTADHFKTYADRTYYWSSAVEFFARSVETAFFQKVKDDNLITGGDASHNTLVRSHDNLQESDPAQSRRLLKALGQMFDGAKTRTDAGGVTEFYTTDLSAFLSNASPEEVMDAAVDEALPEAERKNPDVPTAMQSHTPAHQRRLQVAAYGEEAVFFVNGDNFGEFNTIGRVPTDIADRIVKALAYVPEGVKTPLHAYKILHEKALGLDEGAGAQALGLLGDWLRANMDGASIKEKIKDLPLPDMETYKQNHKVLDNLFVNKEVPYQPKDPSRAFINYNRGLAFGKPLTHVKKGMQEQNAPKPILWTEGVLAEKLGMTEAQLEEALFPNGVGGPASLDSIQYEAVRRFLQWTASAPDYKVYNNKHQAQIFHSNKELAEAAYIPGFIEALGTGVGKTYIHVTIARVTAMAARIQAENYLKENNPKGLSHDKLWEADPEYRKIVSRGVTILVTGGAEKGGLNRGTRKALVDLKMIPRKVGELNTLSGDKKTNETPIIEGIDGKWRYINAPYFTKQIRANSKRAFIPRIGDFIFYDTYPSLMNDSYSENQRWNLPGNANAEELASKNQIVFLGGNKKNAGKIAARKLALEKKIGLRMSKAIEPPTNFRKLLHMIGIEGALEELPYDKKTNEFVAPKNWKRDEKFYDFDRYNEFQGNLIFDEADNMSGVKEQGYGESKDAQQQLEKMQNPAYAEEISDLSEEGGQADPSGRGILGRELTRLLPRARVVFGTATPFKNLRSFSAMERAILTFAAENDEDHIFSMITKIQMGGNQGIIDFLSDLSERGAGIRGNLAPPPSSLITASVSQNEEDNAEEIFHEMHLPIRLLLALPEDEWTVATVGAKIKRGQVNKELAASLSLLSPMIGEAMLMSGEWGERVRQARAQGKSVLIPSGSIGSAHDEEIIKADALRKSVFGDDEKEPGIQWKDKDKTQAIAPADLFNMRGRLKRSLSNALPMFDIYPAGNVAASESDLVAQEIYNENPKTLNVYELFFRDHFANFTKEQVKAGSTTVSEIGGMAIPSPNDFFLPTLTATPTTKLLDDGRVEFTLPQRQAENIKRILEAMGRTEDAKKVDTLPRKREMTAQQIRELLHSRWEVTDFSLMGGDDPNAQGAHISQRGGKITIGVRSKSMYGLLMRAMAQFPKHTNMHTLMTQLQDMFGDDYIEVSGRDWTQKPNPENANQVILSRRDPEEDNTKNQSKFQEKANGAVLFGNPQSMGRGLDFDWQYPGEVDGKKTNKNQTPRLMMIANPPREVPLLMQVFGRILRRSTVDNPDAANVALVSSNLAGMRARAFRSMNQLMRLNELSTGNEKQAMKDAGIRWSVDPVNFFTKDETVEAVRRIHLFQERFGERSATMGDESMNLAQILEYLGITATPNAEGTDAGPSGETKKGGNVEKSDRASLKAVDQLFKRFNLLPQHIGQDLLNTIERHFREVWNENPDKGKSAVLNGNISPIASIKGVQGISPSATLHIFNYQHAPANQSFDHVFSMPPAMKDMDPAEAKQMLDNNHVFYRIRSMSGRKEEDKIIGVDFLRERDDIIAMSPDDRQYRVYEFYESGKLPIQVWKRTADILPKSIRAQDSQISREEARGIWTKGVEQLNANTSRQLMYAIQGNPATIATPGNISFKPVFMPDPSNSGQYVSAYVLDDDFGSILIEGKKGGNWMEADLSQILSLLEQGDNEYAKQIKDSIAYVRRQLAEDGGQTRITFPRGGISVELREAAKEGEPEIKTVTIVDAGATMEMETADADIWRERTGSPIMKTERRGPLVQRSERSFEELADQIKKPGSWTDKSLEHWMREAIFYLGFPIVEEAQKDANEGGEKAQEAQEGKQVLEKRIWGAVEAPPRNILERIRRIAEKTKKDYRGAKKDFASLSTWLPHETAKAIWENADETGFFPNSRWKRPIMEMAFNSFNARGGRDSTDSGIGGMNMQTAREVFLNLSSKRLFSDDQILPFIQRHIAPDKMNYGRAFYQLVMFARNYQQFADTQYPIDLQKDIQALAAAYDIPVNAVDLEIAVQGRTIADDIDGHTVVDLNRQYPPDDIMSTLAHEMWHAIADIPAKKWGAADANMVENVRQAAAAFWERSAQTGDPVALHFQDEDSVEQTAAYIERLLKFRGSRLRREIMTAAGKHNGMEKFLDRVLSFIISVAERILGRPLIDGDHEAAMVFRARRMGRIGEELKEDTTTAKELFKFSKLWLAMSKEGNNHIKEFARVFDSLKSKKGEPFISDETLTAIDAQKAAMDYIEDVELSPQAHIAMATAEDVGGQIEADYINQTRAEALAKNAEYIERRAHVWSSQFVAAQGNNAREEAKAALPMNNTWVAAAIALRMSAKLAINYDETSKQFVTNTISSKNRHLPTTLAGGILDKISERLKTKGADAKPVFKEAAKAAIMQARDDYAKGRHITKKVPKGHTGWVKFAKSNDPDDHDILVEANMLGTNSWCTRRLSDVARYSSRGDFWLYFEDGKPRIQIIFAEEGNGKQRIIDIAGETTEDNHQGFPEMRLYSVLHEQIKTLEEYTDTSENMRTRAYSISDEYRNQIEYPMLIEKAAAGTATDEELDRIMSISGEEKNKDGEYDGTEEWSLGEITGSGKDQEVKMTQRFPPKIKLASPKTNPVGHSAPFPPDFNETVQKAREVLGKKFGKEEKSVVFNFDAPTDEAIRFVSKTNFPKRKLVEMDLTASNDPNYPTAYAELEWGFIVHEMMANGIVRAPDEESKKERERRNKIVGRISESIQRKFVVFASQAMQGSTTIASDSGQVNLDLFSTSLLQELVEVYGLFGNPDDDDHRTIFKTNLKIPQEMFGGEVKKIVGKNKYSIEFLHKIGEEIPETPYNGGVELSLPNSDVNVSLIETRSEEAATKHGKNDKPFVSFGKVMARRFVVRGRAYSATYKPSYMAKTSGVDKPLVRINGGLVVGITAQLGNTHVKGHVTLAARRFNEDYAPRESNEQAWNNSAYNNEFHNSIVDGSIISENWKAAKKELTITHTKIKGKVDVNAKNMAITHSSIGGNLEIWLPTKDKRYHNASINGRMVNTDIGGDAKFAEIVLQENGGEENKLPVNIEANMSRVKGHMDVYTGGLFIWDGHSRGFMKDGMSKIGGNLWLYNPKNVGIRYTVIGSKLYNSSRRSRGAPETLNLEWVKAREISLSGYTEHTLIDTVSARDGIVINGTNVLRNPSAVVTRGQDDETVSFTWMKKDDE